jgi:hypothetical protein
MSAKRGMSKQQRLYYEYNNKEKVLRELEDKAKDLRDMEEKEVMSSFDPHRISFYD